jgi:large conductance mechanosensitive channel
VNVPFSGGWSQLRKGEKAVSLVTEFKEFAMKGNVVDMAVGIVIGAAFGKIVSAFVDAIVMPALGWMIGGVDFSSLAVTLGNSVATGEPVTIGYGKFIQALVDFLIIAAAIFMALKAINRLKNPAPAVVPPPPADVVLLTEIRDILRQQR